jgi:hypothetical protein
MQVDAGSDRNVSNRRFFKLSHRLYCENTAIVDFVARFFSGAENLLTAIRDTFLQGGNRLKLSKRQAQLQIQGHKYKTLADRQP